MDGYTVLIVDDDETQARLLGSQLVKLGCAAVYACDGLGATMQAQKHQPRLVVLDFKMPAADGRTVYERLQNMEGVRSAPVIFVSGVIPQAEMRKYLPNRPGVRFLPKPVNIEQFRRLVCELLPGLQPSVPWNGNPPAQST